MRRTILFLFVADTAALFVNPFADLLRQAPISLAKRNFALPRHPDLVTLNADPPVYEVPGFMSEAECPSATQDPPLALVSGALLSWVV